MARKIQFKRGPKANLPKLSPAELAFTTDEKKAYIGDGSENIRLLDQKDKIEIDTQLADKASKTEVRLTTQKISQTDVTEEFLQQMAGNTPINAVPAAKSIDHTKLIEGGVTRSTLEPAVSGLNNFGTLVTYDAEGRLKTIKVVTPQQQTVSNMTLNYSANGNLESVEEITGNKKVTSSLVFDVNGVFKAVQNSIGEVM